MPFGGDINDLDMDKIAHSIVEDILDVQENQCSYPTLIRDYDTPPPSWIAKRENDRPVFRHTEAKPRNIILHALHCSRLALLAVHSWQVLGLALWSSVIVTFAFLQARYFSIERCKDMEFCAFANIDGNIMDFIGFALFFFLGFMVRNAHGRFVQGQRLWKEDITSLCRSLSNHVLQSFEPGSFHDGDVDRIVGHIAAVPILLVSGLRGNAIRLDEIMQVVGDGDTQRIVEAREPIFHCLDLVRAYLFYAEKLSATDSRRNGMPTQERFLSMRYVENLQNAVVEARFISRVGVPFGYSMHVRVFLMIWLAILPLALVETAGWFTILWVVLIGYGLIGVLHWADELIDPFGCDELDLPLERMRDEVVKEVENVMPMFPRGAATFLENGEKRGNSIFRTE